MEPLPTLAPRPTTAPAPTRTSGPRVASGWMTALGWIPGGSAGAGGWKVTSAFRKEAYGSVTRTSTGLDGPKPASSVARFFATITAEARVAPRNFVYFGLARNVMSPSPASSILATRRISVASSPSTVPPSRAAISRMVMGSALPVSYLPKVCIRCRTFCVRSCFSFA